MHKLAPSDEQIGDQFAQLAAAYCDCLDRHREAGLGRFLQDVHQALVAMYGLGGTLPDVEPASDNATERVLPEAAYADLTKSLHGFIGPYNLYWEIYDPLLPEPDEPVAGNLTDDLTDIYRDVHRGLHAWRSGDPDRRLDGLWDWRFSFETHWGRHSVDALRAIYWLLYDRYLPALEKDISQPEDA